MWMQDGCKVYMDSYMASNGSCFIVTWINFLKPSLGGRPNRKPGDHSTPNAHNRLFILLYHVWGHAWIEIHWKNICLRARSHMASHYIWGSVTTLHDCGGMLGRPLDTFLWALTISWSRLLLVCEAALSTLKTSTQANINIIWEPTCRLANALVHGTKYSQYFAGAKHSIGPSHSTFLFKSRIQYQRYGS